MKVVQHSNETLWIWTSPNGRITHNYKPQNARVYVLYRARGWTVRYVNKGVKP